MGSNVRWGGYNFILDEFEFPNKGIGSCDDQWVKDLASD
jgi:hypothetical protein